MSQPTCYLLSPTDPGVTYLVANRLFNFRLEPHGDHVHCDLTIHIVQPGVALGGGRNLPTIQLRNFGSCRFRLPLSSVDYDHGLLIAFIETEQFQEFALGPLDDLAGRVNPQAFDMQPD